MKQQRVARGVYVFLVVAWGLSLANSAWGAGGDLIWEKTFSYPQYSTVSITSSAISPNSFIVAGQAYGSTIPSIGFIKAFDASTGNIKWEDTLSLGATVNSFGPIAMNGNILVVQGNAATATTNPINYTLLKKFLRGYDVDTGKVLWEVEKDFEAFQIMATSNQPSQQNLVFITGRAVNATGIATGDIFVRAYQARNADVATSLLLE